MKNWMSMVKFKSNKHSLKIPWEMTTTEHLPITEATYHLHRCHISFRRGLWYKGHQSYPPKNSRESRSTEWNSTQVTRSSYNKAFIVLHDLYPRTQCAVSKQIIKMCLAVQMCQLRIKSQGCSTPSLGLPFPRKWFTKRFTDALVTGFLRECSQCLSRATWRLCMLATNHSFGSPSSVGSNPLTSAPNEALTWLNNNREAGINYIYKVHINYYDIDTSIEWNFYSSYRIFIWRTEIIHILLW